jgi:hypothetical protein
LTLALVGQSSASGLNPIKQTLNDRLARSAKRVANDRVSVFLTPAVIPGFWLNSLI